jgi:hypothetical protein
MLARAGGGQAFVPQPPVPSPCFSSPPTTYDLPPTVFTIRNCRSPCFSSPPITYDLPPTVFTIQNCPSPSTCHLKPDTWNLHLGILHLPQPHLLP